MTHHNISVTRNRNTEHLASVKFPCKMAAEVQSADSSGQVIPRRRKESASEFFLPNDTLDQPCDVVLMVKDGKEFKAHRQVLSEASPFFEKLLNAT